ncbi:hypothetical protein Trydic_g16795 [Trypoxylus dichotomus]
MDTLSVIRCICACMFLLDSYQTSIKPSHTGRELLQNGMKLTTIPIGSSTVHVLNIAYNEIENITNYVFYESYYTSVRSIDVSQNRINNIEVFAFAGLKCVKSVDLSDNFIETIPRDVFKFNLRLHRLTLMNNFISFDKQRMFLTSNTIETLILSNNRIDEIYDQTFAGLPKLRRLILSDNDLTSISRQSFRTLTRLSYLSLANTGVHRLKETMFGTTPNMINVENTPLAKKFHPSLTLLRDTAVKNLLHINQYLKNTTGFTYD